MDALELLRLEKTIRNTPFSTSALQETTEALASIKSAVDSRRICQAMSETWQAEVLPLARELLSAKKAKERERGLELFAHVPNASLISEVEAAKEKERSKKLLREYDHAVRRMRKACERNEPSADPLDTTADPLARIRVLANLPHAELWRLTGIRERYWRHIALPTEISDAAGTVDKRLSRLRLFFRSGQTQPYWLMQLLYVAHPLAGDSATQLVWQTKTEGGWVAFRGTTEGGARDAKGNALRFDATAQVRLAHPIELTTSDLSEWSQLAAAEDWSYPLRQLSVPVYTKKDISLAAAVERTPPLDERKMKAWLADEGLEPMWEHEHRHPHATAHVLSTDDSRTWLRLHHDAIVTRRTGGEPIRITRLEVGKPTKRRHSEAVRLLRELAEDAAVAEKQPLHGQ